MPKFANFSRKPVLVYVFFDLFYGLRSDAHAPLDHQDQHASWYLPWQTQDRIRGIRRRRLDESCLDKSRGSRFNYTS